MQALFLCSINDPLRFDIVIQTNMPYYTLFLSFEHFLNIFDEQISKRS